MEMHRFLYVVLIFIMSFCGMIVGIFKVLLAGFVFNSRLFLLLIVREIFSPLQSYAQ